MVKGKRRKKNIFLYVFPDIFPDVYMFFHGCLYVYWRFIMLDKGMKSILKFGQR
jgi:hypothetical protein